MQKFGQQRFRSFGLSERLGIEDLCLKRKGPGKALGVMSSHTADGPCGSVRGFGGNLEPARMSADTVTGSAGYGGVATLHPEAAAKTSTQPAVRSSLSWWSVIWSSVETR